jgi:hypothetical protein
MIFFVILYFIINNLFEIHVYFTRICNEFKYNLAFVVNFDI